jgi:hypothetical protein
MNSEDSPVTLEFIKTQANDSDLDDFIKKILRERILFQIQNTILQIRINETIYINDEYFINLLEGKGISIDLLEGKGILIDLLDDEEVNGYSNKLIGNLVNVKQLEFGDDFNKPLGNSLNKLINLESIYFGYNFNKPLGNSLDKLVNLLELSFHPNGLFNQKLGDSLEKLENLKFLQFGEGFNKPLGNSLDKLYNLNEVKLTYGYKYESQIKSKLEDLVVYYTPGESDDEYLYL